MNQAARKTSRGLRICATCFSISALDWAIEHDVPHGGYCPRGRLAEDGVIPERYHLTELRSKDYLKRTERNVQESDGTVIFTMGPALKGGSKRTKAFAEVHGKPCLHVWQSAPLETTVEAVRSFLADHRVVVLNVAGSRESKEPEVGKFVKAVLGGAWIAGRAT